MGRYAATVQIAASAAGDLLRVTPSRQFRLLECHVTNDDRDDSEQLTFGIYRAINDGGSGTETLLYSLDPGDISFAGSARYSLSAIATKDALLDNRAVNILAGYHYVPHKASRPVFSTGYRLVLRLMDAPSTTTNFSVSLVVETYGA